MAGWGLTEENGNASQVLKVVEMPYINIDTCINTLPPSFREYITGDKICAGYTNGKCRYYRIGASFNSQRFDGHN